MKKIVSFILAAAMLMLCAVSAFATEINWDDLKDQAAETIAATELTDDDRDQGYIGYFMSEDESCAISVMYVDMDGMELEEYKAQLEEVGATDIEDVVVNGLPAVSYMLKETDTACISFVTEAGYILEVAGAPISDEGFAAIVTMVMASIQEA